MRSFFTFLFITFISIGFVSGQIATWNSTIGTGSTNVTVGTAILGAGLNTTTSNACGNGVFQTDGLFDTGDPSPTTATNAVTDEEYIEFPITADIGYNIIISSVSFSNQKSNNGANNIGLYNSTTDISAGGITPANQCATRTISITPITIIGGTTANLRLYAWGASATNGSWRVGSVNFFGSVLPVEFANFTATNKGTTNILDFTTASEINNDYFTIERASNGGAFEPLGTIKGAGDSKADINYTYTDLNPSTGINHYRIMQTDYDGKYSYSAVRSVRNTLDGKLVISPRTTEGTLNILTDLENYDIHVYDLSGKEVYKSTNHSADLEINIDNVRAGIYFVKVSNGYTTEVTKIMKI